jgi:hypothetical protein
MGHRANFVVVQGGRASLYYSRWAAITLSQSILFGPESTLRYIETLQPTDALLDEVWCEGAAVMDRDAKRLLFFVRDPRYHPGLRRYFLPLLKYNWPGWDVRWADQGIVDVALYLGTDPATVRCEEADESRFAKPELVSAPEFVESLLTVGCLGTASNYGFEECLTNLLALGPKLIDSIHGRDHAPLTEDEDLSGGAFLDPDRREMWVWWSGPRDDRHVGRISRSWPGWTVRRHKEGLRRQVELSGRDATHIGMGEEEAIQRIMALLSGDNSFDPREALKSILKGGGEEDVQVGQGYFRTDKPELEAGSKEEVLRRAITAFRLKGGNES